MANAPEFKSFAVHCVTGVSRYDPMTHLLATDLPRAPDGHQKYDVFAWLRDAPFSSSKSSTGVLSVPCAAASMAKGAHSTGLSAFCCASAIAIAKTAI